MMSEAHFALIARTILIDIRGRLHVTPNRYPGMQYGLASPGRCFAFGIQRESRFVLPCVCGIAHAPLLIARNVALAQVTARQRRSRMIQNFGSGRAHVTDAARRASAVNASHACSRSRKILNAVLHDVLNARGLCNPRAAYASNVGNADMGTSMSVPSHRNVFSMNLVWACRVGTNYLISRS